MNIGILGAGAMGSLYGGLLSEHNKVYLVDIWKDHVDVINQEGLKIVEKDGEKILFPKAVIDSKGLTQLDLVIVFVKSIHTLKVIEENKSILGDETIVLSLQNGYGNIQDIETIVKKENIIAGTTSHGATLLGPGKIKHAGVGMTHIGSLDKSSNYKAENIKKIMNESGIETQISENILDLIWSKLIINVGINPLTALLNIENGKLLESNYTLDMMKKLVYEAVNVAQKLGLDFKEESMLENVKTVAKNTANNKSSMLQDVLKMRETEIDKINGAVVKEGTKVGINTTVNDIIVQLIKAKTEFK